MTALSALIAARPALDRVRAADGTPLDLRSLGRLALTDRVPPEARVLLCVQDPLAFIRALVGLDGRVDTILLVSDSAAPEVVAALAANASADLVVSDRSDLDLPLPVLTPAAVLAETGRAAGDSSRWLLTSSGTTGIPKIVPHSLAALTRTVRVFDPERRPVWGLMFDPTRFSGINLVLQALLGGGELLLVDRGAPMADQVASLAASGCTHLSATPTQWRRILMVQGHARLPLRQVTLVGEIADAAVLARLRAVYPAARLTHIYGSTEAGTGFSVTDGQAGFPAAFLTEAPGGVRLRIAEGILWCRPPASSLTRGMPDIEVDDEGFVRTGDLVRLEGDRVMFLGRENGLINIAGTKVYPETVEAVIRAVPGVAIVKVSAKPSPLTGALVVADIKPAEGADPEMLRRDVQAACRASLPREAVPAMLRFVEDFATNSAGKLVRAAQRAAGGGRD
jgi:acyl-CoA synthetase (AMP-forming)/AMP-acid ligase II